ncbi:MAG TPA: hypothetical protein DEQ40_08135 [Oxalobacteraceae bacterium]|jgi:hypothetical protein|nr:hypothetical protein [Oxalobacteraceae bacterium]
MPYSQGLSASRIQDQLNRILPAAAKAQLGTLLSDMINGLNAVLGALDTCVLNKAGLIIKAASSPIVKSVNSYAAMINGVTTVVAASDMSALAGTLATAKSAAWAFYVDGTGAITTSAKTADSATAAAAAALLPAVPANLAQIGFIVVTNTSGAGFIGGTTFLDAAGIAVGYYDTVGPLLPASILSVGDLASR